MAAAARLGLAAAAPADRGLEGVVRGSPFSEAAPGEAPPPPRPAARSSPPFPAASAAAASVPELRPPAPARPNPARPNPAQLRHGGPPPGALRGAAVNVGYWVLPEMGLEGMRVVLSSRNNLNSREAVQAKSDPYSLQKSDENSKIAPVSGGPKFFLCNMIAHAKRCFIPVKRLKRHSR